MAAPAGQWSLNVNGIPTTARLRVDGSTVVGTFEARIGSASERVAVRGTWDAAGGVLDLREVGLEPGESPARYVLRLEAGAGRVATGSIQKGARSAQIQGARDPESRW
jgi:hypothetical protein